MHLFTKPVQYISEEEKKQIAEAIGRSETQTSGEIRVFIEGKCKKEDALIRAKQVFSKLKMYKTKERNGVLVYVSMTNHKLAIYGDAGIHAKVGDDFWNNAVKKMIGVFSTDNGVTNGIVAVVGEIGEALKKHFPYDKINDINELPNEVVIRK